MAEEKNHDKLGIFAVVVAVILFVVLAATLLTSDIGRGDDGGGGAENSGLIELDFIEPPNEEIRSAFEAAAERWNTIIAENEMTPSTVDANVEVCLEGNFLDPNEVFTNLRIFVLVDGLDGPGGLLGLAAPCILDTAGNFPLFGVMAFDTFDIP